MGLRRVRTGLTFVAVDTALVELVSHADNQLRIVLAVEGRRAEHRAQRGDELAEVGDRLLQQDPLASQLCLSARNTQRTREIGTVENRL